MKINTITIYSFLLLLVLFSACKNEEKDNSNTEMASEMPNEEIIAREGGFQVFEGEIDGKYEIIMEVNLNKNPVKGTLIYKSVGVPILLEGGVNNNFLEMKEVINGVSHAKFAGELGNGTYNGIWVKSGSSEKLPLSMKASNSEFNSFIDREKANEIKITGTYKMPKKEGTTSDNEIRLNYTENGTVEFSLESDKGVISGIAQYKNSEITYVDEKKESCSFTIAFMASGLEMSSKGEGCSFGENASVNGQYTKITYEKPEITLK
jgi:hypothetical protein